MTITCLDRQDPFRCPTKWELFAQIIGLLPPGRAWQTREDVGIGVIAGENGEPDVTQLTGLQQWWAALAETLEDVHQRACALLDEWYCATTSAMRPEWLTDWGFPGECEIYDDLCEKVADIPGSTCADLVTIAARRGWAISCRDCQGVAVAKAGRLSAGCSSVCACTPGTIWITIDTAASPAYVAPDKPRPRARCARARCNRLCDPDTSLLNCIIERVRQAHVLVHYEVA